MNPFKTLGRWLWRWWTGREFERKPVAVKPAEASAADFVDSTLPWSVSCLVNDGRGWRTLSTSCRDTARLNVEPLDEEGCGYKITLNSAVGTSFGLNPETGELDPIATSVTRDGKTTVTLVEGPALEAQKEASAAAWHDAIEKMRRGGDVIVNEISKVEVVNPTETPEQFVRRICPNAKLVPYGQKWRVDFGEEIDERGDTETWNKHHTQEEAWQDAKDELLWYGNDAIKKKIANPLAGLTAEQIAARVNRGEPVRLKDAFDALGLKRPTSDNLVVDEAIKATILGGDVYCGEMLVTDAQVQGVTGPLDTLKDVYMLPDGTFTITRPSQDAKPIGRVSKFVKSGVANVQMTP